MAERRDSPVFYVSVGGPGHGKDRIELSDRIRSLTYDDSESKADKCTLSIDNFDLSLLDSPIIRKGTEIEVSFGYIGRMSPVRILTIEKVSGGPILKVEAHDKAMAIHKVQKCRRWENTTRAQVAQFIADEMGFSRDDQMIEETTEVLEQVTQSRMTDAQMLRDIARREGFDFYVDFDGFHFHKRDLAQKPLRTFIWYVDPGQGDLLSWKVSDYVKGTKPGRIRAKGIDPLTKQRIDVVGDNTEASDRTTLAAVLELVAPDDAIAAGEPLAKNLASEWFIPTTEKTEATARRMALAKYERAQLEAIELDCGAVGDPWLVAKSVVLILGIGETLSGLFYISGVKHKVGSGYKMSFKCKSDGKASHTVTAFEQSVKGQGKGVAAKAKKNEAADDVPPPTGVPTKLDPTGVAPSGAVLLYRDTQGRVIKRDPLTGETVSVDGAPAGGARPGVSGNAANPFAPPPALPPFDPNDPSTFFPTP